MLVYQQLQKKGKGEMTWTSKLGISWVTPEFSVVSLGALVIQSCLLTTELEGCQKGTLKSEQQLSNSTVVTLVTDD